MPMFRRWVEENGVVERLLGYPDGERRLTNLLHLAELLQVESHNKPGLTAARLVLTFHPRFRRR